MNDKIETPSKLRKALTVYLSRLTDRLAELEKTGVKELLPNAKPRVEQSFLSIAHCDIKELLDKTPDETPLKQASTTPKFMKIADVLNDRFPFRWLEKTDLDTAPPRAIEVIEAHADGGSGAREELKKLVDYLNGQIAFRENGPCDVYNVVGRAIALFNDHDPKPPGTRDAELLASTTSVLEKTRKELDELRERFAALALHLADVVRGREG